MTRRDLSYILRERKRRANPECEECHGEGTVSYTTGDDGPCFCIMRAGNFEDVPDPLADETASDARELQRERDNYDGPDDGEAWSGGFAPNH